LRDHHHALLIAVALERADRDRAPEAAERFVDFLAAHELAHFALEGSVVLPAVAPFSSIARPVVGCRRRRAPVATAPPNGRRGPISLPFWLELTTEVGLVLGERGGGGELYPI
jgi:hypothetical protein